MTGKVIDFRLRKSEREMTLSPAEAVTLCDGQSVEPPDERFVCPCGGDVFFVMAEWCMCVLCGEYQEM